MLLQVLVNNLILLASICISVGAVFWNRLGEHPAKKARAALATTIGSISLLIFSGYITLLTLNPGKNVVTLFTEWLSGS